MLETVEGVMQQQPRCWMVQGLGGKGLAGQAFIQNGWIWFGNSVKSAMRQCILLTAGPCLQDQSLSDPPTEISH